MDGRPLIALMVILIGSAAWLGYMSIEIPPQRYDQLKSWQERNPEVKTKIESILAENDKITKWDFNEIERLNDEIEAKRAKEAMVKSMNYKQITPKMLQTAREQYEKDFEGERQQLQAEGITGSLMCTLLNEIDLDGLAHKVVVTVKEEATFLKTIIPAGSQVILVVGNVENQLDVGQLARIVTPEGRNIIPHLDNPPLNIFLDLQGGYYGLPIEVARRVAAGSRVEIIPAEKAEMKIQ